MEITEEILAKLPEDRQDLEIMEYGTIVGNIFYTISSDSKQNVYKVDIYEYRPRYGDLVLHLIHNKRYTTSQAASHYVEILKAEKESLFQL